ncbi:helix-turn-helix domain-containing protein [Actinoplanes sp. HUAS TT8]|uniref:helix-turn-helix domain-containing protein n=1 Tax=Actinoplanes sp. HUAS TT8 TaxID=3447453 RepID=UPI003F51BFB2
MTSASQSDADGAWWALGRQLAAYRKAAGFTQDSLADDSRIHYGRSTIANVECGRQIIGRTFWESCDVVLRTERSLVEAYDQIIADVNRQRISVVRISGTALQRPALTPEPIDARPGGDWNSFSRVTRMLAGQRQAVAPAALLSLVEAHRECLSTLFRSAGSDPLREKIGVMLGEASIVASRLWSAQGNRANALAHCAYARTLADDLKNPGLGATARIFESNLHSEASALIGAGGDMIVGLRLLDEAAQASEHLSPAARARIAAEQAQTYAALSLRGETEDALGRARKAAAEIDPGDRIGLYSDWNPNRVLVYEGTCHLLLGRPSRAVVALERAIRELASDGKNANVALAARVDLAGAYVRAGSLDAGCQLLGSTYEQLKSAGNIRGIKRARLARLRLARSDSEPAVRQLDERMRAA